MTRIRTIKPEFWEDEKIASLPMGCRLFFIGTWNIADDLGVFRSNQAILKSKIFPYDEDLRISEIAKWLDALVKARMIIPIIHNGESYYVIRTFRSHQKIDKRYGKPLIEETILNQLIESHNGDATCAQCVNNGDTPLESNRNGIELGMESNIPPLSPFGENNPANKNKNKQPETLQFPFSSAEFMKSWNELAAMPKWKKKPPSSLQKSLNKLAKYNEKFAVMLIENAIAGNYQGVVFDDTDKKFLEWRQNANNNGNTARKKDYSLVR